MSVIKISENYFFNLIHVYRNIFCYHLKVWICFDFDGIDNFAELLVCNRLYLTNLLEIENGFPVHQEICEMAKNLLLYVRLPSAKIRST